MNTEGNIINIEYNIINFFHRILRSRLMARLIVRSLDCGNSMALPIGESMVKKNTSLIRENLRNPDIWNKGIKKFVLSIAAGHFFDPS